MPDPWQRYQDTLALAAWLAGLSMLELCAALTAQAAETALQSLPDHNNVTLRLVVDHGRRMDAPETFQR